MAHQALFSKRDAETSSWTRPPHRELSSALEWRGAEICKKWSPGRVSAVPLGDRHREASSSSLLVVLSGDGLPRVRVGVRAEPLLQPAGLHQPGALRARVRVAVLLLGNLPVGPAGRGRDRRAAQLLQGVLRPASASPATMRRGGR